MHRTRFNTIPGKLRLLPPRYFFISCFLFAFRLYLLPKNERLETENSKYTKGRGETAGYPSLQLLGEVQNLSFLGCGSLPSPESLPPRIPEPSKIEREPMAIDSLGSQVRKQVNGNQLQICWTLVVAAHKNTGCLGLITSITNIEPAQHPFGKGSTHLPSLHCRVRYISFLS